MASTDYDFASTRAAIIAAAYQRIGAIPQGGTPTTAQDTAAAALLNRLVKDLQNEDVFLWQLKSVEVQLVVSQVCYTVGVDANIIGLEQVFYRTGTGTAVDDDPIKRISWREYEAIPDKAAEGTPVEVSLCPADSKIYLSPVPDTADKLYVQYIARLKDWDSTSATGGDFLSDHELALVDILASELGIDYRLPISETTNLKALGLDALKKAVAKSQRTTDTYTVVGAFG